ncbi:MAG: hypothetical protein GX023_11660 [Tissierellia bacterium]|nr:hypothetical protein [Tissierellia bacterium]
MNNIDNNNQTNNKNDDWMNKPIFSKETIDNSIILKVITEIIILIAIYFYLKIAEGKVTLSSYLYFVAGYLLIGVIRRHIKNKRSKKGSEKK